LNSVGVKFLKINFNEVLEELKRYAAVKGRTHGAKAIILAGSLAKGTYTGTSDADVLIIADEIPRKSLDRYRLFSDSSLSIDIEPRIYTSREFLSKVEQGDHFAIEALEKGIALFGEQFFKNLKSKHSIV
jgi:hypothetical protein